MSEMPLTRDILIDESAVTAWAELSGDYNRLHVDPDFAATTPYGRCIAHGPILASHVSEWIAALARDSWPRSGEISFRFQAPVFFPAMVTTRLTVRPDIIDGRNIVDIQCTTDDARIVMIGVASWAADR